MRHVYLFIYFGIYGVCEGGAYVEAQVSALLLSLALLPVSSSPTFLLFSFLGCMFFIPCNFLIFLLHVLSVLLAMVIVLGHLVVRCCKERMLRRRFKQQQVYINIACLGSKEKALHSLKSYNLLYNTSQFCFYDEGYFVFAHAFNVNPILPCRVLF